MGNKLLSISFLTVLLCTSMSFEAFGQSGGVEKPSVMIMPTDQWLISRGFFYSQKNPQTGVVEKLPNYKKAFDKNFELGKIVSSVGSVFGDRKFPLKPLEENLKKLQKNNALDMVEQQGMGVQKNMKEMLLEVASADIILYLTWKKDKRGPQIRVSFVLTATDPYVLEQVGAADNIGDWNSGTVDELLKEQVLANTSNLMSQMQSYFNDLRENGRKISLRIKTGATSSINIDSEVCGYPLGDYFKGAASKMAVNNIAKVGKRSTNVMEFELIRIPLKIESDGPFGKTVESNNAYLFARKMTKMITDNCAAVKQAGAKVTKLGLGEADIVVGAK